MTFLAVLIQSIGLKVAHINGRKKAGICSMMIGETAIRNIYIYMLHLHTWSKSIISLNKTAAKLTFKTTVEIS